MSVLHREPAMPLLTRLSRLKRRHVAIQLSAGAGWGLVVAAGVLLAGAWLDLLWEMPPPARVAVVTLVPLALIGCVGAWTVRAWRSAQARQLARRLDRVCPCEGQILAGVDLALSPRAGNSLSAGLADLAVARAGALA